MNRGNIYASTADVLARTNVEDALKSAKQIATKLSTQDMLGIFAFYVMVPCGFLYTIIFPLSIWFEIYSKDWLIRVLPLVFCAFNVYTNARKMVRAGPNSPNGTLLPSIQKPGFHYCHDCQLNSPPRSFHCPVCNICILRRDHHCSFVGCCIGHFNQRYFVAAIISLWPIVFSCFIWNTCKMFVIFPAIGPWEFWKWMFPHVALVFGFISFHQFLMIAAFAFSLVALFFTTYLIVAQLFCLARGQTRVEYLMDIRAYDLGFFENLNQGLGNHWLLALFSPFASSPLQSNGLSFPTREMEQIGKTTKYF